MATPAFTNNSNPLSEKICHLIRQNGPMPFRQYMEMALYDDQHGYYSSALKTVGKGGDFITSVSVGPCFGLILARRLIAFWQQTNQPGSFAIIEPGAHDGALCADILREIRTHSPECYNALHYYLAEPANALREAQQVALGEDFAGKFSCHPSLKDIRVDHGVLLSNELIDALPVDMIKFKDATWWELHVDECDGQLGFVEKAPLSCGLADFCSSLGTGFPDPYLTEFSPAIKGLAQDASEALGSGLMITIDYGHRAEDYYHPDRSTGTLQTYSRHQKSDDPLASPGEVDITCHVDFSRVIKEAQAAGFSNPELSTQATYLTTHAKDWLVGMEARYDELEQVPSLLRQFQTLTHPALLGSKFMVLEMTR